MSGKAPAAAIGGTLATAMIATCVSQVPKALEAARRWKGALNSTYSQGTMLTAAFRDHLANDRPQGANLNQAVAGFGLECRRAGRFRGKETKNLLNNINSLAQRVAVDVGDSKRAAEDVRKGIDEFEQALLPLGE